MIKRNELIETWLKYLHNNSSELKFSECNINELADILIENFGAEYFKEFQKRKIESTQYESTSWLKFLLSNYQPAYAQAAIEICEVIQYLNNSGLQDYVRTKLKTKKGKLHPQVFNGNYHELFTCYTFLTNGINYVPDYPMKNTVLDGYIETTQNSKIIIECKELKSKAEVIKLYNTAFKVMYILNSFGMQSFGLETPLISGYYIPTSRNHKVQQDLKEHLLNFRKEQRNGLKYLESKYESGIYVTDEYIEGLYENYPTPVNESMIKYKTTLKGVEHTFAIKHKEEKYIERLIQKGIRNKRKQHRELNAVKIISLNFSNFLIGEPFRLDNLDKYISRLKSVLGIDTIVFLTVRDLLNPKNYKMIKYIIAPDNLKDIEILLNKYIIYGQ